MLRAQRSYRAGRMQGRHAAAEAHARISASCRGGPSPAHTGGSPPHSTAAVVHQHFQTGWTRRILRFRHRWSINDDPLRFAQCTLFMSRHSVQVSAKIKLHPSLLAAWILRKFDSRGKMNDVTRVSSTKNYGDNRLTMWSEFRWHFLCHPATEKAIVDQ